ncbi:hypothetical protein OGAPHI_001445 [Ogataea philodendri]|uniref:Exocyst complex component EXO84 n=1 Tax=Ogataea philodendri TaxID=1378263 RepID=A0A9P8PD84_9ASCO|nr:uncharacterized protein OGAPHI_001445 [Ogataea philodendri]KAH3669324.1 hypothetical protein OGAPHI_001445 [Ogataea philodendri]
MDRRLSRANWSTKNKKQAFKPTPLTAVIPEDAPSASGSLPPAKQPPKLKRPHKIDNSGVNRRFSVKLNPQEAITTQRTITTQFPPLPESATVKISEARQPTKVDSGTLLSDLSAESYDAVPYVKGYLKDANATKIDQFARDLGDLSSSNDGDVKHTITQSFNQVLTVSRTVTETEEVLKELKEPVLKLNEILTAQAEEAQEKLENNGKANNRRSVLLLEKKWASNLNTLFKEVEGAQKYVSAIPGRHVVAESKRWGELNAITCKPIRPAHLIVLNDHLLVATRRRSGERKKTVATQCWPLRDLVFGKAPNAGEHTLSIKVNSMVFLFQTDSVSEYNKIVLHLREAKDDLASTLELERAKQKDLTDSVSRLSVSSDRLSKNSDYLHDLTTKLSHRRSRSLDISDKTSTQNLDTVDEGLMSIELYIGHHKYTEAVGILNRVSDQIERLQNQSPDDQLVLILKLKKLKWENLQEKLINLLSWEISNPLNSSRDIQESVELFQLLQMEEKARDLVLESKSKQLDKLVSQLKFEGDLKKYILQMSLIYFTFIKNTYLLYEQCFRETGQKIIFVGWINEKIASYNKLFKRQLMDYSEKSELYRKCVKISHTQSLNLRKIGINVDHILIN